MTIQSHYNHIKSKIIDDSFTFKARSKSDCPDRSFCHKNSHSESINFLLFEYMTSRKDKRIKDIFEYICIPKLEDDIDLSKLEPNQFLQEIMMLKD